MNIIGISSFFHDSAAALISNNKLISASEEERFSRIKHDNDFPQNSINFLLRQNKLNSENLDYVVFYEKPHLKLHRILNSQKKNFVTNYKFQQEFFNNWNKKKLFTRDYIADFFKIQKKKVLFYEHHFSHAASSYYCSDFKKSDLLTIDGVGEWCTTSFGTVHNDYLKRSHSVDFPNSIGLLYSAFTEFLGFEVNEGEFKVMGMAPYGQPKYLDKINKLFKSSDINFELDLSYFNFDLDSNTNLTDKFLREFGERRQYNEIFFIDKFKEDLEVKDLVLEKSVTEKSQYYADIAASLQDYLENLILNFIKKLNLQTKNKNLCYAGGVAYNGSINQKIIKSKIYDNVFIQPAAGDSGGSLGCALGTNYLLNQNRTFYKHTYLGQSFSNDYIKKFLEESSIKYNYYQDFNKVTDFISEKISLGNVIGWFQDRSEFGPRALGNRSILADPRFFKNKRIINSKIKFREIFRPFAPTTLKEYCTKYYNLTEDEIKLSPYKFMLSIAEVRDEFVNKLAAVCHVNKTARVQVLDRKDNERFYELIKTFGDKTGIYTLLNTSFNRKGEPIVNTPEEACNVFFWTDLDYLVIENFIIEKKK